MVDHKNKFPNVVQQFSSSQNLLIRRFHSNDFILWRLFENEKAQNHSHSEEIKNFDQRKHRNAGKKSKQPASIAQKVDSRESKRPPHGIEIFNSKPERKLSYVIESESFSLQDFVNAQIQLTRLLATSTL